MPSGYQTLTLYRPPTRANQRVVERPLVRGLTYGDDVPPTRVDELTRQLIRSDFLLARVAAQTDVLERG
jgi:hypothetical protein